MKTAIYIEDGAVQLVITPENKFEQDAINAMQAYKLETRIFVGQFYACQGGWTRQRATHEPIGGFCGSHDYTEKSLIIRVGKQIEGES